MATLAVSATGAAAFGGPVGFFVAGVAASYLDSQVIMPALFPPPDVKGPRIQEMRIQGADEGDPLARTYGGASRVAASIIWISPLKETKKHSTQGGKGGGGQVVTNYEYSVDIALCWGEGTADGAGIDGVDRIYADTNLVFDNTPNVSLAGTDITAVVERYWYDDRVYNNTTLEYDRVRTEGTRTLVLSAPDGGTDLNLLLSGEGNTLTAGFSEATYNGTFKCVGHRVLEGGAGTEARFEFNDTSVPLHFAIAGETAGASVTIDQTNPKFNPKDFTSITHYTGTETQTADSIIVGHEGAGNVPGFRGWAYSVIDNFQLGNSGNRVPQFSGIVFTGGADDLEDIVTDILESTDLLPAQYDVTALSSIVCEGYQSRGLQPVVSTLQPLMIAFDILTREDNGTLTFFQRANAVEIAATEAQLSASTGGDDPPRPHMIDDPPPGQELTEVQVKYSDSDANYQPGMEQEHRQTTRSSFNKTLVDLQVSMDGSSARDIAARLLWQGSAGVAGRKVTLRLPPEFLHAQENDIISYTHASEAYRILVTELNEGADGIREISGNTELTANLSHSSTHEISNGFEDDHITEVYDCRTIVFDIAPLRVEDTITPTIYFAVYPTVPGATWRGASVYESLDGITYTQILTIETAATAGRCTSTLGASVGSAQWDNAASVTVELFEGTLESVTALEVLNGANRAVIGGEIVGFKTATLVSGTTYTLTGFLRGLGSTETLNGSHDEGEVFVFLNDAGVVPQTVSASDQGVTKYYKSISPGAELDTVAPVIQAFGLESISPYSPVYLKAVWDAPTANDITFSWTRRARTPFRVFSQSPVFLDDENYEVRVFLSATLVRTITTVATANGSQVTAATQSCVYDQADQTADGITHGTTIEFKVVPIATPLGRGKASEQITLTKNT